MATAGARSRAQPLKVDLDCPFELNYVAEGAAHIVYELGQPQTRLPLKDKAFTSSTDVRDENNQPLIVDSRFKGKLLRLRKNIPSAVPVRESYSFFQGILRKYNQELRKDENKKFLRNEGRAGTYLLEDEPHGTLITNMLGDDEHASCDFKPKWLLQSPSAPKGAKRCRTCALREMRNSNGEENYKTVKEPWCPLSLITQDNDILRKHLSRALTSTRGASISMPKRVGYAITFLEKSPMLHRLKELQAHYDPIGPLKADPESEEFRLAMTLRDCSVFMKISNQGNGKIEARLGDLDLKSSNAGKAEYWRNIEQKLIDGGWYRATESKPSGAEEVCLLSTATEET